MIQISVFVNINLCRDLIYNYFEIHVHIHQKVIEKCQDIICCMH